MVHDATSWFIFTMHPHDLLESSARKFLIVSMIWLHVCIGFSSFELLDAESSVRDSADKKFTAEDAIMLIVLCVTARNLQSVTYSEFDREFWRITQCTQSLAHGHEGAFG